MGCSSLRAWRAVAWCLVLIGCGGSEVATSDTGTPADGGTPADTGTTPDTGRDAGAVCTSDPSCSDGQFCNGVERCMPAAIGADTHGCVTATTPCMATQTCDEVADACMTVCAVNMDADGDHAIAIACGGDDCDDANPHRFPTNPEICDPAHVDEDCDATTLGQRDADGDGVVASECCNARADGILVCGEDCNDLERTVSPTSSEVCDLLDNDCDGAIDERVSVPLYPDADFDLHGDATAAPMPGCPGYAGLSPIADDCDDGDPARHPAQPDFCNGVDDDCDANVDEATGAVAWYRDADGDGFGLTADVMMSCAPLPGRSLRPGDCDDTSITVSPGTAERCNGLDDDCNGRADYHFGRDDFEDDDRDGAPDAACAGGSLDADCNDRDPTIHPGAPELVDGRDNDCDTMTDEMCVMASWFVDADADGWGAEGSTPIRSCDAQAGRVTRAGDCNDADGTISPAERDLCNGTDDDCDGAVDETAGRYCYGQHVLGLCYMGGCLVDVCEQGWGDCDTSFATGCESDLAITTNDCGHCGVVCGNAPLGTGICRAGLCALACDAGYADCDHVLANGCEIDVHGDESNCGLCGRSCGMPPGATGQCALGTCRLQCGAGFTDCDGTYTDGCEIATGRDTTNCGMCGQTCGASQICLSGGCVTPAFPSDGREGDYVAVGSAGLAYLAPGVHQFRSFTVPAGVTLITDGTGVLEIYASGPVQIAGTIDLSGGAGVAGSCPSGGATGTPMPGGTTGCTGGPGGAGAAGEDAILGVSQGYGFGGRFGGGGGGAGYFSRPGGSGASGGASTGGAGDAGNCSSPDAQGGIAPAPYGGGDATHCATGGGGSIGADAAADLAVASTFRPGSGGGGNGIGGSGGGGGGAVRIASAVSIDIAPSGAVLANGGRGGGVTDDTGAGGGSGGVVVLVAPSVHVEGRASALGGLGFGTLAGAGGLGRIAISTLTSECSLGGSFTPPLVSGCVPSATSGRTYVGPYPPP